MNYKKRQVWAALSVGCMLAFLAAIALPAEAQVSEDRTPTGGSNITTRKCVGGGNAGMQCNDDSDCDSNDCFDYNIVDLTVNFRNGAGTGWTPTAAQMTTIRGYWTPINDAIADITDGQMVLGTISLVVNNGAPNAVVQLNAGQCSAGTMGPCVTTADCASGVCNGGGGVTNTGGWGSNGQITVGVGCLQNPLCFAHEFMHLIGNVRDEYEGAVDDGVDNDGDGSIDECQENQSNSRCFGGTSPGAPCSVCGPAATNANQACTFNNQCNGDTCNLIACPGGGTCRRIVCIDPGPPAGPTTGLGCLMRCCLANSDSDLCWSGNHDPTQHTEQDQCRSGNDCWTQFGLEWPTVIQVPAGAPATGPATAPAAVGFLTPSVLDRFVAVIDRSDSMDLESPRRIDVAVTAVKDFIDLLSNGTDFGLASYASADGSPDPPGVDSTKDFPPEAGLRALNAAADRTAAKNAADGLSSRTGGFTRIGAGLLEARDMLMEAGGTVTLNTSVLLLTDGLNNRPEGSAQADLDAALATLAGDNIPVFVTCIGAGRDSVQCSDIADQTAGRFVDSVETDSLYDAFVEFAAEAEGKEIGCSQIGVPIAQDELSAPVPALIEPGATEARFVVTWTNASSDLDLRLFRPDDTLVPTSSKIVGSQGESYLISNPQPGIWTMHVFGFSVTEPEKFSARSIVDHQELKAPAGLAKSNVQWPDGFLLSVNPSMGLSITDCSASVLVEKPDGTTDTFELRDDGLGVDTDSHDGLYQAEYRDFTAGDGNYTFTVTVRCDTEEASFHQHEDPGIGVFPIVPVIPTFERVIRFSGTISGVPANLPPTAEICMDVRAECTGAETAAELDGTCSSDPEGGALTYQWSSPTGTFTDSTAPMTTGLFPYGFNDVSLVVTDPFGASSAPDTGLVVIADTIPPTLDCPDSLDLIGADCLGYKEVPVEVANAMDSCGLVSVVADPPAVDCYDTQTVTIIATDQGGNQSSCEFPMSVVCPGPSAQGYWHRQCLGVPALEGGIDPGRKGRGPSEPTEPLFVEELIDCVDVRLEDLGYFGETTCRGMDADPAGDDCERALKQLTAILLNECSMRVDVRCAVDVASHGCTSTTLGDLIDEIAGLISVDQCQQASQCAAAINSGSGLVPGGGPPKPTDAVAAGGARSAGDDEASLPAIRRYDRRVKPQTTENNRRAESLQDAAGDAQPWPRRRDTGRRRLESTPVTADDPVADATLKTARSLRADPRLHDARRRRADTETGTAATRRLDLQNKEDSLLRSLKLESDPQARMTIVRRLFDPANSRLHATLERFLVEIRADALDAGLPQLVREVDRLRDSLRLPQE